TEAGELTSYEDWLKSEAEERSLTVRYHRFPIVDLDVPSVARMREILTQIARALEGDAPVYVHCWGGIGRTGTVVGCWLVEGGASGGRAAPRDARRPPPHTRTDPRAPSGAE